MAQKKELIPFQYNLPVLTGVMMTEKSPFYGYIKEVTVHFPPGCFAYVHVKVGHGTVQFCPREGYLSLDNTTPTFDFNEEVDEGEPIWVEMRNADIGWPHNISVEVFMKEPE